jgi:hypothetical protein
LVQPSPHFFKAASNTMPLAQPSVSLSTGRLTSYFFAAAAIASKIGSFSTVNAYSGLITSFGSFSCRSVSSASELWL